MVVFLNRVCGQSIRQRPLSVLVGRRIGRDVRKREIKCCVAE